MNILSRVFIILLLTNQIVQAVEIRALRIDNSPQIDGQLNDDIWQQATPYNPTSPSAKASLSKPPTTGDCNG